MKRPQIITILLVEDNRDHAELTIYSLKKGGIINQIILVEDGEAALDYLYNRPPYENKEKFPLPAIVLLDLKLPKLDGIEVLRRIKSDPRLKPIPIIILTSSEQSEEVEKCYEFGANSYVTKPVKFEDFYKKVQEIQFYWALVSILPESE